MLEEERKKAETETLERLRQYVYYRARAFEAFQAVDPEADYTLAAKERLEKARKDLADFEAYLGQATGQTGTEANSDEPG